MESISGGDVTVIVPAWNRRELLERLLGGLRAQTRAAAEVLVVDDGSTDGLDRLLEPIAAGWPQLRLLRHWQNLGGTEPAQDAKGGRKTNE